MRTKLHKSQLKQKLLVSLIFLFFVFDSFLIIFIYSQNKSALGVYNLANQEIKQGQYSLAASNLNIASKYYSLPSTRNKIKLLIYNDSKWVADQSNLNQAKLLASKQKYTKAALKLKLIGKDFPSYNKVLKEEEIINSAIAQSIKPPKIIKRVTQASSSQPITIVPAKNTIPVYAGYGYNFYYAGARQSVNALGASVTFPVEDPSVGQSNNSSNHSLMELAIEDSSNDTVEMGWMVDQPQYGDSSPHLFVYHFSNGQTTCYNTCGFVTVSKNFTPGQVINAGTLMTAKIEYLNNEWQVFYNGNELGYFPASAYSDSFTSASFIQIYGEVATTNDMCIQMGNGISGGQPGSIGFSNFSLIGASTSPELYPYQTKSSPYSYGNVTPTGLTIGGAGSC